MGHEAPPCGRPERHPALDDAHGGQCPRLDGLRGAFGLHQAHQASEGKAEEASREASRLPKAYDDKKCARTLKKRAIKRRIARKEVESSQKLGRHRWVAEWTLAWLAKFRRLAMRYERRADIHEAFVLLGCSLICYNQVS
jgi:transposase